MLGLVIIGQAAVLIANYIWALNLPWYLLFSPTIIAAAYVAISLVLGVAIAAILNW